METCIICNTPNEAKSIEHIVSESLGNKFYVLKKGALCDVCNNRFSKFEQKALGQTILSIERARLGVPTKRNKTAKGNIDGMQVEGDQGFQKNFINVNNFQDKHSNFNPIDGTFKLTVPSINTQYDSVAKLLLKTGIESIFTSRKQVFYNNDFDELRDFLSAKPEKSKDWPFITTTIELDDFHWIPENKFHHNLLMNKCILKYAITYFGILFKFKYGSISMIINLSTSDFEWIIDYKAEDSKIGIFPEYLNSKIKN
jgi:hypothetical protein